MESNKPPIESPKNQHSKAIDEILKDMTPAHQCPKCGGSMAHFRLKGYRCLRCD